MPNPYPFFPATITGLSYSAGGRLLLDDLTFTIPERGRTLIMGANGAGKSLLLRLLHGLLTPEKGVINWNNAPSDRLVQKSQAMVFQKPVMLRRSVRANLDYVLKLADIAKDDRKPMIDELMEKARLSHCARQAARTLSGGEQQRLAIARALAVKPRILFLDEPTVNMDLASTKQIEDLIEEITDDGIKIIMVTHDIGQAKRLGDHIIFLDEGKLSCDQTAGLFLHAPESEAARKYLAGEL